MSKIELRPKRPPCPEGKWKMICFKEEIATYTGTKGEFQRQIFRFQCDEEPGMLDWQEDDGSEKKIRFGVRASLPVPTALTPGTNLWKFLDQWFGPSWQNKIEELDDISTGKKTRVIDTAFVVDKQAVGKVVHNERGYAEIAEIEPPDQEQNVEFVNYFPDKDDDAPL